MIDTKIEIKESENNPPYFIEGRTGEVIVDSENNKDNSFGEVGRGVGGWKSIGFIGEIHPKILKNWKIKMPVTIFEINLEEIFRNIELIKIFTK